MDSNFLNQLAAETEKWQNENIITAEQRKNIISLYDFSLPVQTSASASGASKIRFSHIIIGFASVLLFTGIILFYAANWKEMSPMVKTIQVFCLLIINYGVSFFFLYLKKKPSKLSSLLGRIFLLAGQISFGVAIMLISQIYHISSHPANGVLIWALGALLISIVVREKWGYYLSSGLFFIWNVWEFGYYQNVNYLFVLFPVILFILFYREKAITGIFLTLFGLIYWFIQINVYHILISNHGYEFARVSLFLISFIPLGVLMISLSKYLKNNENLKYALPVLKTIGWLAIIIPFVSLSWPIESRIQFFPFLSFTLFHSIEFLIIFFASVVSLLLIYKKSQDWFLLSGVCLFSLILFLLPAGNKTVMMITYHVAIPVLIFSMLYEYAVRIPKMVIDTVIAFSVTILFLIVKIIGLLSLGIIGYRYLIAYYCGAIIFGTVIYLINEIIGLISEKNSVSYQKKIINTLCAFIAYFILYMLSYKTGWQNVIFDADKIVIIMIFLFIGMSLVLYSYLYIKTKDKILVVISSIIFTISVVMLFIAGPDISWKLYSLVFNAALLLFSALLIFYSSKVNSVLILNFTIAGFTLHIITRYFDLIWDLLSGSILFIISGILGILGGLLIESKRRKIIKKMHAVKGE